MVQTARFRRFLKWLVVPFCIFGPFDVALYLIAGDVSAGLLGGVVLALIPLLVYARRLVDRGELTRAVMLTTGILLCSATVLVFIRPYLYPVLAVGCLLAVAVALPFVGRATLHRLVYVGAANSATIVAAGVMLRDYDSSVMPAWFEAASLGASLFAVMALVFLMIGLFSGRLTDALQSTKKSQTTLALANEQLRRSDRAKTQFMNMTAHEFSTPLTPIRIQLHLMQNVESANLNETQKASLAMIQRNFLRLSQLAADLLDMTRVEAGKLRVEREPVRLGGLCVDSIRAQQGVADTMGIRLSGHIDDSLIVSGDARRLSQVIDNYVSNALKFTGRGGSVRVDLQRVENMAFLTVTDSGLGLEAPAIAKLFQPFSQLEPNRGHGMGLGLFISRGIVEAHGGRVWAESKGPGTGSTFGFALPLLVREIVVENAVTVQRAATVMATA